MEASITAIRWPWCWCRQLVLSSNRAEDSRALLLRSKESPQLQEASRKPWLTGDPW